MGIFAVSFLKLKIMLTNVHKAESFVNLVRAYVMFDVTCFPAFLGTPVVISTVLSIHQLEEMQCRITIS